MTNTRIASMKSDFDDKEVNVKLNAEPASENGNKRNVFKFDNDQVANIQRSIGNTCLTLALSCTMFLTPNIDIHQSSSPSSIIAADVHPPIASAADYGSLSEEQKAVAEAWRIVDNNFIDRTFNNQDWFKIRQDAVKQKYKTNQEALDAIDKIVSSLGDKYTRYLPQAKYRSIVDAATGTLAGVGVEISVDKETGKIFASDVEPSSPALNGR